MALFTVEVSGRAVLVFSEGNRRAAEQLLASAIGPDLLDFEEEEGRPVWDGEERLTVRKAHPEEAARWERGLAEAKQHDGSGESGPPRAMPCSSSKWTPARKNIEGLGPDFRTAGLR